MGSSIDWLPDGRLLVTGEELTPGAGRSTVSHAGRSSIVDTGWNEIVVDCRGNVYDRSPVGSDALTGDAAGVPFVLLAPHSARGEAAAVLVWHMHEPPRSERAMAAALPLRGLDAWRVYLGLPLSDSRLPAGGLDAFFALGYEDAVSKLYAPAVRQAVAEFSAGLRRAATGAWPRRRPDRRRRCLGRRSRRPQPRRLRRAAGFGARARQSRRSAWRASSPPTNDSTQ